MSSDRLAEIIADAWAELEPDDGKRAAYRARARRRDERRMIVGQLLGYADQCIAAAEHKTGAEFDRLLDRAESAMRRAREIADGAD
jgi:hypothetical protein